MLTTTHHRNQKNFKCNPPYHFSCSFCVGHPVMKQTLHGQRKNWIHNTAEEKMFPHFQKELNKNVLLEELNL